MKRKSKPNIKVKITKPIFGLKPEWLTWYVNLKPVEVKAFSSSKGKKTSST
jgi:hypothetical protein